MNALKISIIIIGVALAASVVGNALFIYTNNLLDSENNRLTADLEQAISDHNTAALERDVLKANVDVLVAERDSARTDVESLQGQVNQLTSDVSSLIAERDSLKTERDALISERDAAIADVDKVRTRWRLINHYEHNDGSRITFSGIFVNTGLENLENIQFHVTGYDMTSKLVIDLYVGNLFASSGYSTSYNQVIEYAPLVLSEWDVELVYGNQTSALT